LLQAIGEYSFIVRNVDCVVRRTANEQNEKGVRMLLGELPVSTKTSVVGSGTPLQRQAGIQVVESVVVGGVYPVVPQVLLA
ncbi:hypothetical protein DF186_22200, partial [Enterococcus hirae]